jgi:hypothetical protein
LLNSKGRNPHCRLIAPAFYFDSRAQLEGEQ